MNFVSQPVIRPVPEKQSPQSTKKDALSKPTQSSIKRFQELIALRLAVLGCQSRCRFAKYDFCRMVQKLVYVNYIA